MKLLAFLAAMLLPTFQALSQFVMIDETNTCAMRTDSLNPRAPLMLDQVVCAPVRSSKQTSAVRTVRLPQFRRDDPRRFEFVVMSSDDLGVFTGLKMQGKREHLMLLVGFTFTFSDSDGTDSNDDE